MPLRLPEPGDPFIRAADLRAIADELVRQGKFSVDEEGTELQSGASGVHISRRRPKPAFWARLTSEGTGADAGRYAWVEQERSAIGAFTDLQYGRVGTVLMDPAVEHNGARGLKTGGPGVGLYVWLVLGFSQPVQAGVRQEWLFAVGGAADPSAVVQVTSTRVASIYYRSFRGTQFNEPTRRFTGKVEILVLDAADIQFPP